MTTPDALTVLRELETEVIDIRGYWLTRKLPKHADAAGAIVAKIRGRIARLEREQAEAPIVYCRRCGKEDPLGHD